MESEASSWGTSFNGIGKRYAVADYIQEEDVIAIYARLQALGMTWLLNARDPNPQLPVALRLWAGEIAEIRHADSRICARRELYECQMANVRWPSGHLAIWPSGRLAVWPSGLRHAFGPDLNYLMQGIQLQR